MDGSGWLEVSSDGIPLCRIDSMLRTPNCPFVLFVGTKKLVKRKEFEQFISEKLVIEEVPKNLQIGGEFFHATA